MKKAIIIVLLVLLLAEALLVGMCISALRAAGDDTPGQKKQVANHVPGGPGHPQQTHAIRRYGAYGQAGGTTEYTKDDGILDTQAPQ